MYSDFVDGLLSAWDAAHLDGLDQEVLKALLIQLRHSSGAHQNRSRNFKDHSTRRSRGEIRPLRYSGVFLRREADRKEEDATR